MRTVVTRLDLLKGRVLDRGVKKEKVATTLADHYADAGSVGTAETDLYFDALGPDVLTNAGDKVEARYGGTFVSSVTATRRVRVYFGNNLIFDSTAVTVAANVSWSIYLTLVRVDAATVRYMVTGAFASTSVQPASVGELTGLDLTTPVGLKLTAQAAGTGAATGDVVARMGYVEYKPPVT
jgi:hypothetical protein